MARVPQAVQTETLRPLAGARQQAFDNGADALAQGGAALGRGVSALAQGIEQRNIKIDEAFAQQADAGFAQAIRPVERGFLSAKGGNAIDAAAATEKAWGETASNFLRQAKNDRQRSMIQGAINRRRERWAGQYDSHLSKETDRWHDESETARISQASVDVVDMPVGSLERMQAADDLAMLVGQRAARKGLSAEAANQLVVETFTTVHATTIDNMIANGDAVAALEYLKENGAEILPDKRAEIQVKVESAERDWQAYAFRRSGALAVDPEIEEEVEVIGEDGAVTKTREVAILPVGSARISSGVGIRPRPGGVGSRNHQAIDYAVPVNTPVKAMLSGVARIKNDPNGYGTYVVIEHGNGLESVYAHLNDTNIRDGDRVEVGQTIALSGGARGSRGAGNSQGPHLHFEVRRGGRKIDPSQVVGSEADVSAGSGRRRDRPLPGMPTTPDDARSAAEAYAQSIGRGNDWRLIKRLEEEGLAQLSQDRAAKSVRETEAWSAIEQYLPHGSSAVGAASSIPPELWNRLSEGQKRQARGMYEAAARGDGDGSSSVVLVNDLLDLAAGQAADQADFLNYDLDNALASGYITNGQYSTLRNTQRQIRAAQAPDINARTARNALEGMGDRLNQYARVMGIYPAGTGSQLAEKQREYNDFRMYMTRSVVEWQALNPDKEFTEAHFLSLANAASRQVVYRTDGQREVGRAYQDRGAGMMREYIPNRIMEEITARLRRENGGRDPSLQQVSNEYVRGIRSGLYDPNVR